MNTNSKQIIDFPDGALFLGPHNDPYLKKHRKKVDYQAAMTYAKKAWSEGKELTFDEMQQFIVK